MTARALLGLSCCLGLAACGGGSGTTGTGGVSGGAGASGDYTGNFAIQGTPHGGTYLTCTAQVVGGLADLSCVDLHGCPDTGMGCALSIRVPAAPGTYSCRDGSAMVLAYDPGYDSGVGWADCEEGNLVAASPSCPADSNGCNQLVGDCTVNVNSVSNMDQYDFWGHFSGSLSATVWTGPMFVTCAATGDMGAVGNLGGTGSISASGAW